MLLTDRAELVHLDNASRITACEQPRIVAVAQPPRPVDIHRRFGNFGAPGEENTTPLEALRMYLASCCAEHEHALLLPPELSESN